MLVIAMLAIMRGGSGGAKGLYDSSPRALGRDGWPNAGGPMPVASIGALRDGDNHSFCLFICLFVFGFCLFVFVIFSPP